MTTQIKKLETKEELKMLYDCSAMTWEGLVEKDHQLALKECGTDEAIGYQITGKQMNDFCHLTGTNKYPNNLSIFAITKFKGLAIQYGARWMDDIIDNNARREDLDISEIF